jgi:hypothetical protein
MKRPASYVLWGTTEALYVGATENIGARLTNHSNSKAWWPDVLSISVLNHASMEAARRSEARLIADLSPIHNVIRSYVAPSREANPPGDSDVLSVEQAAAALSITPRAVRHRIKAGTLAATKLGPGTAAYVITREEIEAAKDREAKAAS